MTGSDTIGSLFLVQAVGQNQWYYFGVGAQPIIVYFRGDWDVHWGHGILTHGQHGYAGFFPVNPFMIWKMVLI